MADHIAGFLEVGPNDRGEIVVHLPPDAIADFDPVIGGHLAFSPNQARQLARLLLKHAVILEGSN